MKRRLLAMLLAFALTISVCPANALALNISAGLRTGEIPFAVNPLYAGVLDTPDFDVPDVKPGMSTYSSDVDYLTEEQAVAQIRENMKSRAEIFTVHLQTTETDVAAAAEETFFAALEHTGDPVEGDYLKWQWGGYGVSYSYYTDAGTTYADCTYTVVYYTTLEQEAELDAAIAELLASPELDGADDYEKIRFLYDYICNNVVYDYDNLENEEYTLKFTAYAAMMNGTAVCQGYALLLYRLALEVGIDSRLIAGSSFGENHGWNIVKLGDLYYNLDSTWDAGMATYTYFLKSECDFPDHTRFAEYATDEFYAQYPMANENYTANFGETIQGTCGENITWVLENGELTIRGEGEIIYPDGTAPWIAYKDQITSLVIGEGITAMPLHLAFYFYTSLKTVSLPDSLENIGYYAFQGCYALESMTIPKNVNAIMGMAFHQCSVMSEILVSEENAYFDSIDGVLFDEGGYTLLQYPCGKNKAGQYMIPEGTAYIGPEAFRYCELAGVEIPETVGIIMSSAFANCYKLTKLVIPAGVYGIDDTAFGQSDSLQQIVFCGDMPSMSGGALADSTAVCYYPAGNATWVDFAPEDYGGTTIAIAYETLEDIPETGDGDPDSGDDTGDDTGDGSGTDDGTGSGDGPGSGTGTGTGSGTGGGSGYIDDGPDVTEDTLTWTFADGVLTISGEGPMKDYTGYDTPWDAYREQIESVVIKPGVTTIGKHSFECYTNLVNVGIPDTVTKIKEYAFAYCSNLTNVTLPPNLLSIGWCAFSYCGSIDSIVLPEGLLKIDTYAFNDTAIRQVIIPASVSYIGARAFGGTLAEITVDSDNAYYTVVDGVLFDKEETTLVCYPAAKADAEYTIPDGVTTLGNSAFEFAANLVQVTVPDSATNWGTFIFNGCTNLEKVNIPEGVTTLEWAVFGDCASLTSITLPDSVTSIGTCVFYCASSLQEIVIPEGVTFIGIQAFQECNSLTEVVIPDSVTALGHTAFGFCKNLKKISIGSGLSSIDKDALHCDQLAEIEVDPENPYLTCVDGVLFSKDMSELIMYLRTKTDTSYTIPDTVTTIAEGAFLRNPYLESVTIPGGVTSTGDEAFVYCTALKEVAIASGVTEIGRHSFAYCDSLRTVQLPDMIRVIGNYAFAECSNLEHFTIPESVHTIGEGAFDHCHGLTSIVVPDGVTCIDNYTFSDCIALKEIVLPEGVERIGISAFYGCAALDQILLPDSTVVIDQAAFYDCNSLARITIPASMTNIGMHAFGNCDLLKKIVFEGNVPVMGAQWLLYVENAVAYYPQGNESWTTDVMQNYGGVITWVAAYKILAGGDSVVEPGSGEVLSIRAAGEITKFENVTVNGEVVDPSNYTVTEGSTIITFSEDYLNTLRGGNYEVCIHFTDGVATTTVSVEKSYTPGDINGDGAVNNKDLTRLFQYLSDWDVEVVEEALDINGDGAINNKDLTRLFQYLSDWDVEIF